MSECQARTTELHHECRAAKAATGDGDVGPKICVAGHASHIRGPWWLVPSQWWRWRDRRLWRGKAFDPHVTQQVTSYAVINLPQPIRDVFLLSRTQALDYAAIGRLLGLSKEAVEAHLAAAICQAMFTVKLIETLRPERRGAVPPEVRHG